MRKKVTIIGAGNVGASTAQLVAQSGMADVILFDIAAGLAEGKALDIAEACPLWGSASQVTGTTEYAETAGSDLVVITAGLPRKPGMSRDDLLAANAKIISTVTEEVTKASPGAMIIVVTNPMDVMTQLAFNKSGLPHQYVMGMGGVLDSARFRTFIAWELGVSPKDVDTMVLGGHGDQMVPMPRFTTVNGIAVTELIPGDRLGELIERTKGGGAEIVAHLKTGSAYYAPAAATFEMLRAIIMDEKRVLPVAAMLTGQYGADGVYAGVPVVLGAGGVEKIIELELTPEESELLTRSVQSVRGLIDKLLG